MSDPIQTLDTLMRAALVFQSCHDDNRNTDDEAERLESIPKLHAAAMAYGRSVKENGELLFQRALTAAKRGEFVCPGCGQPQPPLTEQTAIWAFYCASCRDGDPSSDGSGLGDLCSE